MERLTIEEGQEKSKLWHDYDNGRATLCYLWNDLLRRELWREEEACHDAIPVDMSFGSIPDVESFLSMNTYREAVPW